MKPQQAHSGHHSPRRRCYKTWCGVCGSGGHVCGSGMAPCPVTADDDGNVKIHSSPLQRMGSALHSGMCHCHGVPGISSGRADGHGCQEGDGDTGQTGPSSHQPGYYYQARGIWLGPCKGLTGAVCWSRGTQTRGRGETGVCVSEVRPPEPGLLTAPLQCHRRQSPVEGDCDRGPPRAPMPWSPCGLLRL